MTDAVTLLAQVQKRQAEIVCEIERLLAELKGTLPKPVTQRGTPRVRSKGKGTRKQCQHPRCSNGFIAYRVDARFCPGCRKNAKRDVDRKRKAELRKGVTLMRNTPSAGGA